MTTQATPNSRQPSVCKHCGAVLGVCCCGAKPAGTSNKPNCDEPPSQTCEPPPRCPHPGTVEFEQNEPPPKVTVHPHTTGKDKDRPKKNSPEELEWFKEKIKKTLRDGPQFGPRKDEFLPFLLVRSAAGDTGNRPSSGVFWESPDIYVLPDVDAAAAPLMPPGFGAVAKAGKPNTLYAHVWNLGKAPAYRVRVEFYWFNPSLGISRSDAHLIGSTWVDLGNRFSRLADWTQASSSGQPYMTLGSHAIVRCPTTWVPEFVNNGHECLVVRVSEPMMDAVSPDQFNAAADRHVGQRNIAVVNSSSPANIDLHLDLGFHTQAGEVEVEALLDNANDMEWLKLHTHQRDLNFAPATEKSVWGMFPASPVGGRRLSVSALELSARAHLLRPRETIVRGCEPLSVLFHAGIANMLPGQAQLLRIRQRMHGVVLGGYTVVLLGK